MLYNEIAKKRDIFVLYTQMASASRNADFYNAEAEFKYAFWHNLNLWQKTKFLFSLFRAEEVIIGGWDNRLNWLLAFLLPRKRNSVVVESSILESVVTGWKAWLKKIFLSRISKAYCSGVSNAELMRKLHFKGEIVITRGVGLYRRQETPQFVEKIEPIAKFLYVGRLSPEKNLKFLISVFNELPEYQLTIAGFGPLEKMLKSFAGKNITFAGAIPNAELPDVYKNHDCFVLFSKSESWGLVVEEAMNNGLPVILSEHIGCAAEIVSDGENGLIVPLNDKDALKSAVKKMCDLKNYNYMRKNVCSRDYAEIERQQIECYLR